MMKSLWHDQLRPRKTQANTDTRNSTSCFYKRCDVWPEPRYTELSPEEQEEFHMSGDGWPGAGHIGPANAWSWFLGLWVAQARPS